MLSGPIASASGWKLPASGFAPAANASFANFTDGSDAGDGLPLRVVTTARSEAESELVASYLRGLR